MKVIGTGAAGMARMSPLLEPAQKPDVARCYQKEGFIFDTGEQFMAMVCANQIRLCRELSWLIRSSVFT